MDSQTPYIVLGGELVDTSGYEFRDTSKIDFVGIFPNYQKAYDEWRAKAQQTVDTAIMRYFIIPLDKYTLSGPENDPT